MNPCLEQSDSFQEKDVIEQSFVRNTLTVKQHGYADGLSDGRDTLYQEDFNRGYHSGLLMAFKLAQHHGFSAGFQKQVNKPSFLDAVKQDLILQKESARAHCLLCCDKTLEQNSLKDLDETQTKHNEAVLMKLKERYDLS